MYKQITIEAKILEVTLEKDSQKGIDWSGLLKETFTDADNFGVVFPAGSDARQRAVLLGAVFLIDFAHFEKSNN